MYIALIYLLAITVLVKLCNIGIWIRKRQRQKQYEKQFCQEGHKIDQQGECLYCGKRGEQNYWPADFKNGVWVEPFWQK